MDFKEIGRASNVIRILEECEEKVMNTLQPIEILKRANKACSTTEEEKHALKSLIHAWISRVLGRHIEEFNTLFEKEKEKD